MLGERGASAATVPTMSSVKEIVCTKSYWLKKLKKAMNIVKVQTEHRNSCADGSN